RRSSDLDDGNLIPLEEPVADAAVWHVPMTEEEAEKVRQTIALRRDLFDGLVIRRFAEALDMLRAGGLAPYSVWEAVNDTEFGRRIADFRGPMYAYNRRGNLLNDPDLREWMTLDQLKEFGRVYRGWQGVWIAREQRELRKLQEAGEGVEDSQLMPGYLDNIRKTIEFLEEVKRSLYRSYGAGDEGFLADVRGLDLTPEQTAEIDRIAAAGDTGELTRFLQIAFALTDAQNRELIKLRNPERWEAMLLPPPLDTVPETVTFQRPKINATGPDYALVAYEEDGRLKRLPTELDLAALRAVQLPEDKRAQAEQIVAEREAIFDDLIMNFVEQIRWICATGDLESMSTLQFLMNEDQLIQPIRHMGMLMMGYYGRGNLLHDTQLKELLSTSEHEAMRGIYEAYSSAWVAQCKAEVEAGQAAGLEFDENNAKEGNLVHLLRMRDFMRKARQRIAQQVGATEDDLVETVRQTLPADVAGSLEPLLERFAGAGPEERIELFWTMLLRLTPEQALGLVEARRPEAAAPPVG
ncbi:MAG: hypothetical protein ACF8R7_16195, partial [Phycisphaerales bacterium JB039]